MEELTELERLVHAYEVHKELQKYDKRRIRKSDARRVAASHDVHKKLSEEHNLEVGECERLAHVSFLYSF
jgi:hypothetical protein